MSKPDGSDIRGKETGQGKNNPGHNRQTPAPKRGLTFLTAGIAAVIECFATKCQKQQTDETWERKWRKREVWGIWAAAGVGLMAVIWSGIDAHESRSIMQGQLDEARNQRLLTIQQLRARFRRNTPIIRPVDKNGNPIEKGATFAAWSINPTFLNVGATDARDVRSIWRLGWVYRQNDARGEQILNCPPSPTSAAAAAALPVTIAPGGGEMGIAKFLGPDLVKDVIAKDKVIYMTGRIDFRDVFFPQTPVHHLTWCVGVLPNDPTNNKFSFPIVRDEAD